MVNAFRLAAVIAALIATALPARAGERDQVNACKAMVARADQAKDAGTRPDDAALAHCRQIMREWTLRDSRMLVDEEGRRLR